MANKPKKGGGVGWLAANMWRSSWIKTLQILVEVSKCSQRDTRTWMLQEVRKKLISRLKPQSQGSSIDFKKRERFCRILVGRRSNTWDSAVGRVWIFGVPGISSWFCCSFPKELLIDLIDQERRMSNPLKHLIICRELSKFEVSNKHPPVLPAPNCHFDFQTSTFQPQLHIMSSM